jgi:hypothetical protein
LCCLKTPSPSNVSVQKPCLTSHGEKAMASHPFTFRTTDEPDLSRSYIKHRNIEKSVKRGLQLDAYLSWQLTKK